MKSFPIHSIDTAPAGSRETLEHVQKTLGGVPNLAAAMAESPSLVKGFFALRDIYIHGTLDAGEIQALSLTNAVANGCTWCVAFHSHFALQAGISRESVDALRDGRPPLEPRLKALCDLSRTLIARRGQVSEHDLEAFYAAGYSPAQALEVVLGIAFSTMANFAGHLADAPLDEPFKPYAWTAPRLAA